MIGGEPAMLTRRAGTSAAALRTKYERTFDTEPYWAGLNLSGQAPAATATDVELSPAARFAITARADWSTAAATTIDYQGTPVTAPVTPTRTGAPR